MSDDVTNEEVLIAVRELTLCIKARFDGAVASDFELDSTHGNPKVRFDPKTWRGPPCKGRKLSECPAKFLDHYAQALSNIAEKEDADRKVYRGRPASKYTRLDAARARGWALRHRLRGDVEEPAPATPRSPAFGGGGTFGRSSTFGSQGISPPPSSGDDLADDEDDDLHDDDDPL